MACLSPVCVSSNAVALQCEIGVNILGIKNILEDIAVIEMHVPLLVTLSQVFYGIVCTILQYIYTLKHLIT